MDVENLLDIAAVRVESWPCECPDTHRRSGQVVSYCPRHVLGPALVNELTEYVSAAKKVFLDRFTRGWRKK